MRGVGVHPPPSPARTDFTLITDVRQKAAVATLCTQWFSPLTLLFCNLLYTVHVKKFHQMATLLCKILNLTDNRNIGT